MPHATNIPSQKASQGSYSAFVPAPLPPELNWTPRLIGALSDADRLVGRLAGEGGRFPNPHILIRPFVQREAVLSSKIEGTQATLGELLRPQTKNQGLDSLAGDELLHIDRHFGQRFHSRAVFAQSVLHYAEIEAGDHDVVPSVSDSAQRYV